MIAQKHYSFVQRKIISFTPINEKYNRTYGLFPFLGSQESRLNSTYDTNKGMLYVNFEKILK